MDRSGRRDRESHAQSPATNGRDGGSKKRRRSPSPMKRDQRPFRKEDGGGDHQKHDKKHVPYDRSVHQVLPALTANRGKKEPPSKAPDKQSDGKGAGSSMPFVRNDRPYKYEFGEDDDIDMAQDTGEMPDDATLRKVMGFAKFRTSHELKIPDNDYYHGIMRVKTSQYRQYMNRRDGFNRPLSPPHD